MLIFLFNINMFSENIGVSTAGVIRFPTSGNRRTTSVSTPSGLPEARGKRGKGLSSSHAAAGLVFWTKTLSFPTLDVFRPVWQVWQSLPSGTFRTVLRRVCGSSECTRLRSPMDSLPGDTSHPRFDTFEAFSESR